MDFSPVESLDRSIRYQEAHHLPLWAHSYASLLLENGVDIYTIKSLMGHTNVKTTQIYTHIVNEQKEKAANTLHIENLDL